MTPLFWILLLSLYSVIISISALIINKERKREREGRLRWKRAYYEIDSKEWT